MGPEPRVDPPRRSSRTHARAHHRSFLSKNFHEITALNPNYCFIIREAADITPRFDVTFHPPLNASNPGGIGLAELESYELDGLTCEQIEDKVGTYKHMPQLPCSGPGACTSPFSCAACCEQLKEIVQHGMKTPQVWGVVPKPIVESLAEDYLEQRTTLNWPGPALNYKH